MRASFPDNCPECRCELYPSHHTRPRPSRTLAGRVILIAGFLLGGATLLVGALALQWDFPLPMVAAVLIALVPALLVAGVGAVLSERCGLVLKVRCRKCGWAHTFPSGYRAYGTRHEVARPE